MIIEIVLDKWQYKNANYENTNFILYSKSKKNIYETTDGFVREYFNVNGSTGDTFLLKVNGNNEILDIMLFK